MLACPQVVQRLTAPHYYGALCLLVDEAGFLLESKTAALIAELPANEAKLVAADSIVRALGVTDGPGFEALMEALTLEGGNSASRSAGGARACERGRLCIAHAAHLEHGR